MLILLKCLPTGIAIGKVHLKQPPLFLRELSSVEEGNECDELVMKLSVHRLRSLAVP
jgi:hypothetical protein